MIKEFDKNKTYNKFVCNNNYIGILGEIVLHKHLNNQRKEHVWLYFNKGEKNTTQDPDFIINGQSIDLKTTTGIDMWTQQPKHDIYIHAIINKENTILTLSSFTTKEQIKAMIDKDIATTVKRNNNTSYIIPTNNMIPIEYMNI